MKRTAIITIIALICLSGGQLRLEESGPPRIHNLALHFLTYWDEVSELSHDQKVERFYKQVFPTLPEFYNYRFDRWKRYGQSKVDGLRYELENFESIRKEFSRLTFSIEKDLRDNLETFASRFPDWNRNIDIFVIHSLGELDGGVRHINGKAYFLIGLDGMIRYHNAQQSTAFFHHELFHSYHLQHFRDDSGLWSALWREGLATYVSHVLNPQSNPAELLLDIPSNLINSCEEDLPTLWKLLYVQLQSRSDLSYENFFRLSSTHPTIPKRSGYYLGYLIVKRLAQIYPLRLLIQLEPYKANLLVRDIVFRMSQEN